MYSENEKISLRQLKRLIVFDFFGVISLIVPYLIVNTTGYDGILAILIGGIFAVIYLLIILYFVKNIKESYLTFSKRSVGTVLTFIIGALYVIKFSASIVFFTKLFSEVINQTLLEDYPAILIIIPMILVAGYLAYKGVEVRARVSEVLYFIILVPILIYLLTGVKKVDLSNLTPILNQRFDYTLLGAGAFFLLFNILELLLFIKPFVKVDVPKRPLVQSLFSYSLQSIIIIIGFSILFFILTVGIIGETAAGETLWSTVIIMQFAQLPGTFLNRQDSLILALWLFTIFSLLSGFLYYLCYIMKDMFRVRTKNCLMPLIMLIIIIFSAVPIDLSQCFSYYMKYLTYIGVPQSILIPLILLLVHRIRENKPAIKGKSISFVLLLILVVPALTSCSETVQIEDRELVQAIGVDFENDQLKVYYVLPDLGALTEQGSIDDKDKLLRTFTGGDFYDIEEQYKLCSAKKLDYSHLKAIILSKQLSENKELFKEFVEYVEDNYEISKNTYVFLAENSVPEIVDFNKDVQDGIGYYLERLYQNNLATSEKEEVAIGDLINEKNNNDMTTHLPMLTIYNDSLSIQGEGIVKNSTLMYEISGDGSIYTDILRGYGENSRIFLTEDSNNTALFVIRLNNINTTKELQIRNGKPLFKVNIEASGIVEKGLEADKLIKADQRLGLYQEIENLIDHQLEEKLTNQMVTIMSDSGIDYLNVFRMTRYKKRELYRFYKEKQSRFLEDMQYDVSVNVKLK